jgi:hypothetical protein
MSATGDLGGDKGLDILIGAPDEVSGSGAAYLVTIRANKPPVANAGPDQLIECDRSRTVTLDGSKSYDPDKDAIAYTWKQVSGTTVERSHHDQRYQTASDNGELQPEQSLASEPQNGGY